MNKIYFDKLDAVQSMLHIKNYLVNNNINVNQIVGLTRGGLVPAVMLSHFIEKPMIALNKDFYSDELIREGTILVIDEINDTGVTLNTLEKNLRTYYPDLNVKYAVLVDNASSSFRVDVAYKKIDKAIDPSWIVFWWEEWWKPGS